MHTTQPYIGMIATAIEVDADGFYITEKDYEMRKEGDIFGVRQSGDMSFKIASLRDDYEILLKAREDSEEYLLDEQCKDELKEFFVNTMNTNY